MSRLAGYAFFLLSALCLAGYSQSIKTSVQIKGFKVARESQLEITPSVSSSENDFDFLQGKWKVVNRKLKTRLNNCTEWKEFESTLEMRKILTDYGNREQFLTFLDGKSFEAIAIRLFNKETQL